jgi:hypothetical protein
MGGALDLIKYYFNNALITSQLTLNFFENKHLLIGTYAVTAETKQLLFIHYPPPFPNPSLILERPAVILL